MVHSLVQGLMNCQYEARMLPEVLQYGHLIVMEWKVVLCALPILLETLALENCLIVFQYGLKALSFACILKRTGLDVPMVEQQLT
jgi:hypothetical protein